MKSANHLENLGGLFARTCPQHIPMTNAAHQRVERPSSPAQRNWYLGRNGEQHGPFAFAEIVSFAGDETIDSNDLVWRPGFSHWVPVNSVSGLLSPPPLPVATGVAVNADAPPPLPLEGGKAIDSTSPAPTAQDETFRAADPAREEEHVQAFTTAAETGEEQRALDEPSSAFPVASALLQVPSDAASDLPVAPAMSETSPAPEGLDASDEVLTQEQEKLRGLVSEILEPPEPQARYFVRHWRGELSFSHSLFVNGILLTAAMGGAYAAIAIFAPDIFRALASRLPPLAWVMAHVSNAWEASPPLLRITAMVAPWIAAGGVYIWSLVGIFRSAINRL